MDEVLDQAQNGSPRKKAALLIVDMQEDFCPPNGALAVPGGRDIAPAINQLLSLPFDVKYATRDFHPARHVSFASSHQPPNNKAFESKATIQHPREPNKTATIPLWPEHCVQGTKGAEIIREIDASKIDQFVDKGRDESFEMFSAFSDVFGEKSSESVNVDLANLLRDSNITQTFVVGLAGDYCVRHTAVDAKKEGFEVYVVEDAVKSIDSRASGWGKVRDEMESMGIQMVNSNSPEILEIKHSS